MMHNQRMEFFKVFPPVFIHVFPSPSSLFFCAKQAVKGAREAIASNKALDLAEVQKAFDLQKLKKGVDSAFDEKSQVSDQAFSIDRRKAIDKVLRQVVSDVVIIEDELRDLDPSKTGKAR